MWGWNRLRILNSPSSEHVGPNVSRFFNIFDESKLAEFYRPSHQFWQCMSMYSDVSHRCIIDVDQVCMVCVNGHDSCFNEIVHYRHWFDDLESFFLRSSPIERAFCEVVWKECDFKWFWSATFLLKSNIVIYVNTEAHWVPLAAVKRQVLW